ncbi:MAG TPA: hypothetical protein VIH99_13520 [Bdellovibrionota bacterium]
MIFAPLFLKRDTAAVQDRPLLKHRAHERLQRLVLATSKVPLFRGLYTGIYALAIRLFVSFTLKAEKELGIKIVNAIYLRRGAGRGELVVGASDLDFFVVLHTVSAQQEMLFLKSFWKKYNFFRNLLPFLGETLMGDHNELEDWLQTGCVRAFETGISWKLLHGRDVLRELPAPAKCDARDVFSEALKCYWSLVQPVLKMQDEHLQDGIKANGKSAILLRHGIKAALDLFRLHYALGKPRDEALRIHSLSRTELLDQLPKDTYGDFLGGFRNLLALRDPLFESTAFDQFSEIVYLAFRCLDDMAAQLDGASSETTCGKLIYHSQRLVNDPYSLSVRELFAERVLFRHRQLMKSCVLSESTAQMYFRLNGVPSLSEFRELLMDLRNVSFSLERFNVPMPLSDACFLQMEKTSLLDTPFHSFYSHREEFADESGAIHARPYPSPVPELPLSMLRKTFSELSFALRMQPSPEQFDHFVEKIFAIVLALRLAVEKGEVVTSLSSALGSFAQKYPGRHEILQKQISPFFHLEGEEEKVFWDEISGLLEKLGDKEPARALTLRNRLMSSRFAQPWHDGSATKTTDLWINLTPFLRMEMNAIKDRLFPRRPILKL